MLKLHIHMWGLTIRIYLSLVHSAMYIGKLKMCTHPWVRLHVINNETDTIHVLVFIVYRIKNQC